MFRQNRNNPWFCFRQQPSDDFSLDDFVPPGGGLPDHLKGKSAEEVAQYYSGLLRVEVEKGKNRPPTPTPPPPPPNQPPPQPQVLTEADVAPALGTMVASARLVAKSTLDVEGQKLWDRFLPDVENIMKAGFKGVQLADAQNWLFAYNQVLGSKTSLLMKEAREAEVSRRTAETSSGAHAPAPAEITLEPIHEELAEGLNMSKDDFKNGIKIMREDKWPLTFSNRP